MFAVDRTTEHLTQFNMSGRNIIDNCDIQAAVMVWDTGQSHHQDKNHLKCHAGSEYSGRL